MAKSNMVKKFGAAIDGILSLDDGQITLEVDGVDEPISLADFIKEFDGKSVKISVGYANEI